MTEHHKLIRAAWLCLLAVPFLTAHTLAQSSGEEAPAVEITDPAVIAVQESKPRSPAEIMRAAKIMTQLDEIELARGYLAQLLEMQLPPKTLAALNRRFGSPLFVRMRSDARLQPEGGQLGEAILVAAQQVARDPQRIAGLMRRLTDSSATARHAALIDLQQAGPAAIGPLVRLAAENKQPELQYQLGSVLASFGETAIDPLIAVLKTSDPVLRSQAIHVLGRIGDPRAVVYLLRPALSANSNPQVQQAARTALRRVVGSLPARWEAEHLLRKKFDELSHQLTRAAAGREDYPFDRWHWDDDEKTLAASPVDAELAIAEEAADIASELHELATHHDFRHLFVSAQLAAAKLRGGFDQPLGAEADAWVEGWDSSLMESVLEAALEENRVATALATIEILREIGNQELLNSPSGHPRALVRALDHPHPRVRFAAAEAVVSLDPQVPYPGSSRLIESLVHFAGATGSRTAVVGFPTIEFGQNIAGLLNSLGFDVELAFTGKELFKKVTALPDCELIFVSDGISKPAASHVIQSLRLDGRTAAIPIGLMSRLHNTEYVHTISEYDSLVEPIAEPHSIETAEGYVHQVLSLSSRHSLTAEQRLEQARRALGWLVDFAADRNRYGFYELLCWERQIESALYIPELSPTAAQLLGRIGSSRSQRALVDMASQTVFALEQRQSAADGLDASVRLRGTLLTTDEILRQYERYNSSRLLDKETQAVLGAILDTLESRGRLQP